MMRTVLALDDLLAQAVEDQLPGVKDICGRQRMRDEGDDVVRRLVEEGPCVLAIGGAAWEPSDLLGLLERWRFPRKVPVVLVMPAVSRENAVRISKLGVYSVFEVDAERRGVATSLVAECLIAHACRRGILKRPVVPVLVQPSPRAPACRPLAQVIAFPVARRASSGG